jgi:hypothetical protein
MSNAIISDVIMSDTIMSYTIMSDIICNVGHNNVGHTGFPFDVSVVAELISARLDFGQQFLTFV